MSASASQASAFYREVVAQGRVWTVRDSAGIPAPANADGDRAMPFWSTESRVRKVIAQVPTYAGFEPQEIGLTEFRERWLPGLARDGLKVGVNWSGDRATGYDVEPEAVELALLSAIDRRDAATS